MTDFRKLSLLPESEDYWHALEARMLADLAPQVRSLALNRPTLWAPLAKRAAGLGGLAAAAAVTALLFAPARFIPPVNSVGLLRLPEEDPILEAFLSTPTPPPLASLIVPRYRSDRDE